MISKWSEIVTFIEIEFSVIYSTLNNCRKDSKLRVARKIEIILISIIIDSVNIGIEIVKINRFFFRLEKLLNEGGREGVRIEKKIERE